MSKKSPRSSVPEAFADQARGIRLQKAMAQAGVASRRDCEKLIEAGHVRVNGQVVAAMPAWVDPGKDRIEVNGHELARPRKTAAGTEHTTLMLHKPRRVISTTRDDQGRTSVIDLVNWPGVARLFPVGRLDADSTGLILLTDDGELANRLTHPRYEVAKEYRVTVRGKLSQADLQKLRNGLMLSHQQAAGRGAKRAAVESIAVLKHETDRARGDRTHLRIVLREGQNREIRRLVARLGFKVRKLKRTAIGPVKLKGLAAGQWRKLSAGELAALRKAAGLGTKQNKHKR